ncbi:hypothetical protein EXIGLDRAFT_829995 [Exidia glandulosa HHB12029]|uniref:Uncharacterized protein n=1 Tax=Exidia glandulosa HHB12029 TaxID=1314781 RepID=A0A166BJ05_EXIGL|nr:hypothetical protein EXIGLDRAFT_829995 [Exidia glandulosa HHB12029]
MNLKITTLTLPLLLLVSSAVAQLGIFHVIFPDSSTVWQVGEQHNVTFVSPHSGSGNISLSTLDLKLDIPLLVDTPLYSNPDVDSPYSLANITVPDVSPGTYYIVLTTFDLNYASEPFGIGAAASTTAATMTLATGVSIFPTVSGTPTTVTRPQATVPTSVIGTGTGTTTIIFQTGPSGSDTGGGGKLGVSMIGAAAAAVLGLLSML